MINCPKFIHELGEAHRRLEPDHGAAAILDELSASQGDRPRSVAAPLSALERHHGQHGSQGANKNIVRTSIIYYVKGDSKSVTARISKDMFKELIKKNS